MIRIVSTIIGIVALISVSALAGPELRLSEAEFNFGYAPQTSKLSHVFWIHSVGDEELKITKVDPGCGCTKAPLESDIVAPGDSARLEIIFDTQRYSHRVMKRASIEVEGIAAPHKIGIISYVVTRPDSTYPLTMRPHKLDLSQYGATVRDRASLTLTNVSSKSLAFRLIAGPEDWGTLALPESIGPGESAEIELVLDESVLGESFEKSITFVVDDEPGSRYTIPVRRRMRDPQAGSN